MKIASFPLQFNILCVFILIHTLAVGTASAQVLVSPAAPPGGKSGTGGSSAMDSINEGLNSNEGGTVISVTKDTLDHGLNTAASGHHQAAWQGNKGGASSKTIGDHLGNKGNLKNASGTLGKGATVIDHAGYTSTAAGEVAGGRWGQAVITVIDGVGKAATSFVGGTIGGALGSAGGPAGTIAGGAAGAYAGSSLWDATGAKLTKTIKDNLGKQEDKKSFGEMAGPKIPAGKTPEQIHQDWLNHKANLDKKNQEGGKLDKGDLKGNEAATSGAPNDKGTPDGVQGNSLDGLVGDKASKSDAKAQSTFDTMKGNSDVAKASTAGDQQISDAKNLADKAGNVSQDARNDSANQTASANNKDSWISTIIGAVTKGLETGASALGDAIGTGAGSKAASAVFDSGKGKRNKNPKGTDGDGTSTGDGEPGDETDSEGGGKTGSSSGGGEAGICNDGDRPAGGGAGTSAGNAAPTGPYASAITQYGKPTGYTSDGRPYWGTGSKKNPYTDHGIEPVNTAPTVVGTARPTRRPASATVVSTPKPSTPRTVPVPTTKPSPSADFPGKFNDNNYDPNYRDPNLVWTAPSPEQTARNLKDMQDRAAAMAEARKNMPK